METLLTDNFWPVVGLLVFLILLIVGCTTCLLVTGILVPPQESWIRDVMAYLLEWFEVILV